MQKEDDYDLLGLFPPSISTYSYRNRYSNDARDIFNGSSFAANEQMNVEGKGFIYGEYKTKTKFKRNFCSPATKNPAPSNQQLISA